MASATELGLAVSSPAFSSSFRACRTLRSSRMLAPMVLFLFLRGKVLFFVMPWSAFASSGDTAGGGTRSAALRPKVEVSPAPENIFSLLRSPCSPLKASTLDSVLVLFRSVFPAGRPAGLAMGGSLTPPSPGLPPAALEMLTLFMEAVSASGEKPTRFTLGPRMSALLPGVLGEGVGLAGMAALAGSSLGALVLMNLARWGLSQACSHSALAPGRSPGAFFSAVRMNSWALRLT
mmetsp:Transcript_1129/g.2644  ORF Transcript_1129/g.2644 Transcript_1129/m.2644 type:complete len:234 (+) Transcript_1129:198-899(+)